MLMHNSSCIKKLIVINLIALIFLMQLPVLAEDAFYDFSDEAQERFSQQLTPIDITPSLEVPKKEKKKAKNKNTDNNTATQQQEQLQQTIQPLPQTVFDNTSSNKTLKGNVVFVQANTTFPAVLQSTISSSSLAKNDTIAAVLPQDWVYNGVLIAPQGSIVYGKAVDVKKNGGWYANGKLAISFNEILNPRGESLKLVANVVTVEVANKRGMKIASNIAGGAVAGAAMGALAALIRGGDITRALIVGASIGTVTGGVSAATHKGEDIEISAGTGINVRLVQPMNAAPYN